MIHVSDNANSFRFEPISWKSYNSIKKKAMEQEFSWSGLLISLSIAFFVVLASAQGLRFIYDSTQAAERILPTVNNQIYQLENVRLNKQYIQNSLIDQEKIEYIYQQSSAIC